MFLWKGILLKKKAFPDSNKIKEVINGELKVVSGRGFGTFISLFKKIMINLETVILNSLSSISSVD